MKNLRVIKIMEEMSDMMVYNEVKKEMNEKGLSSAEIKLKFYTSETNSEISYLRNYELDVAQFIIDEDCSPSEFSENIYYCTQYNVREFNSEDNFIKDAIKSFINDSGFEFTVIDNR